MNPRGVIMELTDGGNARAHITQLTHFLSRYNWLLDSYVIEFFTEDHWTKLPLSWQDTLSNSNLPELSRLLLQSDCDDQNQTSFSKVYPLSLLAFSATCHSLSLPRTPTNSLRSDRGKKAQLEGLDHLFRCHIKPKKQHEIKILAEVVNQLSLQTKCRNIVDVGSGKGHLARYLAYHYGLCVTAVEGVGDHLTAAAKYDRDVEKSMLKRAHRVSNGVLQKGPQLPDSGGLTHIEALVQPEAAEDFLSTISSCEPNPHHPPIATSPGQPLIGEKSISSSPPDSDCILVGLHTCGDLGPTILRTFTKSKNIVGVVSVGCCYMKLTNQNNSVASSSLLGYPMSEYVRHLSCCLSYEAREVACHSIEMYRERLKGGPESFDHLRVHCHRAAVEILLRKQGLKRSQVRISKKISKLPFKEYAKALLYSVSHTLTTPIVPPTDKELDDLSLLVASQWQRVVVFFMLRLCLAPCVESLVLLDRAMFLLEQGSKEITLMPLFDPILSPRNYVVMAT